MKRLISIMTMLLIMTSAYSQNCLRVIPPTKFTGPDANGKYKLSIVYDTDGNKTLQTTIFCDGKEIFKDCFQVTGSSTKEYDVVPCAGGLSKLTAEFITRTGSCNSAQCSVQTMSLNVLPIRFKSVDVVRLSKTQCKVMFEVAEVSGTNNVYKVRLSNDGIHFIDRAVIFPDDTVSGGKYEVIIRL